MQVEPTTSTTARHEAGELIGGRYRLEYALGEGGMGSVWKAEHVTLHTPVAVKFITPSHEESEDALARFMREAQAAAALRSTHIVQVFDFGVEKGAPYMAMELLEGESLATRLLREGRLSPAERVSMWVGLLECMRRSRLIRSRFRLLMLKSTSPFLIVPE